MKTKLTKKKLMKTLKLHLHRCHTANCIWELKRKWRSAKWYGWKEDYGT